MGSLLSYHGDPAVKAKYVERFAQHRALDQVIQGTGFDPESGRGCFVGCTLDDYNHSRFPIELGWPEWMAQLADSIFEGLPKAEAPQFGTDLLDAVQVGVDLEPVRHLLAARRLTRLIEIQNGNKERHPELTAVFDQTIAAVATVIRCHETEAGLSSCTVVDAESAAAWSAAWSAAESAAESAESAAWSAESAAESAWSAWSAARSARWARWAAESAAESAESAAFQQERDDLLGILRSLKHAQE